MGDSVTIVGCGDIGSRVAQACMQRGAAVTGWVRSDDSVIRLRERRIPALKVDLDLPVPSLPSLQGEDLYYFAPPPAQGREDSRVAHLLSQIAEAGQPRKVVYLSTTGVYGDCGGEWVDESRPPAPAADRAYRRLDAENRWRAWSRESGGALVILRVAGIYGPGKLPESRLRSGRPMVAEADAPITNHIHTLDLVEICLAAMSRGAPGELFNVCDGHPGSMTGYFNTVADFLGLPRPPTISLAEAQRQLTPGMLSYLGESRRLSNRKLVEELGVELRYPTLAEGLPASLGDMK
jgi:nucleoside-diphosphate-sugar epimerase